MSQSNSVLICDLDNTLYDWVEFFVPAVYGMIGEASKILECDESVVIADLRVVHQQYHDSEHPFSLLDTEIVRHKLRSHSRSDAKMILDPAFHVFNQIRKNRLRLYDGVLETLSSIAARGITIVAHTESKYFAAVDRVCRLGLDSFFRTIYCLESSESRHPDLAAASKWNRTVPVDKVVNLPRADRKPSARVLRDICKAEGIDISRVMYIGDSVARDVVMAKDAGAFAVWAAYGARPNEELYRRLVAISHWTAEDVERERGLRSRAKEVSPDFVCDHSFSEVLDAIDVFESRPTKLTARF
jgi:FMN phosphatase YigB (HAD superfamily)